MGAAVQSWILYLQSSGALVGVPLLLGGLVLMLGGWRLWRLAVVVSLALVGAAAAAGICDDPSRRLLYALVGGVVVGAASWWPARYAAAVVGGVIGASVTMYLLEPIGLEGPTLLAAAAGAFIVFCALSALDLRQVIIIITAFEGAMLVISAAVAFSSATPSVFNYFKQMSGESLIFLPFLLTVPTVIGVLLQMADVNRRNVSLA